LPSPLTGWRNDQQKIIDLHDRAMRRIDLSLRFEEWGGTWIGKPDPDSPTGFTGDAAPTGRVWTYGGEWSPTRHDFVTRAGPDDDVAVTLTVQTQQSPALQSIAQFLCAFGGERSGKTFVGREIVLAAMVGIPRTRVFYLLPRFSKTGFVIGDQGDESDDGQAGLIDVLDDQGWIARRNKNEHRYITIHGSSLQVFSAADRRSEESFLGGEADIFVIEEFREMHPRVFQKAFSRIISTGGRLIIVSSPEAGHMIEEIDRKEFEGKIAFDVHHLSVEDNFFIHTDPQKSMLEIAAGVYDERMYKKKVLGQNVQEYGADFYNWDRDVHVSDELPGVDVTSHLWRSDDLWLSRDPLWRGPGTIRPDPALFGLTNLLGMDFGASVASAILGKLTLPADTPAEDDDHVDLTWMDTCLVCVREFQKFDSSTVDFVETVLMPAGILPGNTAIFCDPAGKQRSAVDGKNSFDFLRECGYHVFCKPGGTLRGPGINAIRVRLQLVKLIVLRGGCPTLIKNMPKVRTIGRSLKEVSRDPDGHLPDALRYKVDNIFPFRDLIDLPKAREAVSLAYSSQ
jgi:hypothetical protein